MSTQGSAQRRLTQRQAAVLAAVERLGRPNMLDLHDQFPNLAPSAVHSVLEALRRRGLIDSSGDDSQRYLGGVSYWSTAISPTEVPRPLAALGAMVEGADLDLDSSVDHDARAVVVLLPLSALTEDLVAVSPRLVSLRTLIANAATAGRLGSLRISSETTIDSQPETALRVELIPNEG